MGFVVWRAQQADLSDVQQQPWDWAAGLAAVGGCYTAEQLALFLGSGYLWLAGEAEAAPGVMLVLYELRSGTGLRGAYLHGLVRAAGAPLGAGAVALLALAGTPLGAVSWEAGWPALAAAPPAVERLLAAGGFQPAEAPWPGWNYWVRPAGRPTRSVEAEVRGV